MARALLKPLLDQGVIARDQVQAVVASEDSARRLQAELGVAVGRDPAQAWAAPAVLLAVKPQLLSAVAAAAPPPHPGDEAPLLISVLAGVTLERLERSFPGWRCVRAVPNTPCLVGAGITGLAWGKDLPDEQRQWVLDLFARVGVVKELPESQLDGLLALASSGPALAAVLLEALADGGVASGLPRPLALELALGMMVGSVKAAAGAGPASGPAQGHGGQPGRHHDRGPASAGAGGGAQCSDRGGSGSGGAQPGSQRRLGPPARSSG